MFALANGSQSLVFGSLASMRGQEDNMWIQGFNISRNELRCLYNAILSLMSHTQSKTIRNCLNKIVKPDRGIGEMASKDRWVLL